MYIFTQGISYHFERNPTSEKKKRNPHRKKKVLFIHMFTYLFYRNGRPT